MALLVTAPASGVVWTTTAGNKATASFTPPANALLLAFVGIATLDTAPTMADSLGGATWALLDSFRSQATTGGLRCYVRSAAVSGAAMTVSYTSSGDAGGGIFVIAITGTGGVYGTSAIGATGGQADQAAGTPAPVLSVAPAVTSAIVCAVMTNSNVSTNTAPPTGFTEHYDQGFNTPASGMEICSINRGITATTQTFTAATATTFASLAIEVKSGAVVSDLIGGLGMIPGRRR